MAGEVLRQMWRFLAAGACLNRPAPTLTAFIYKVGRVRCFNALRPSHIQFNKQRAVIAPRAPLGEIANRQAGNPLAPMRWGKTIIEVERAADPFGQVKGGLALLPVGFVEVRVIQADNAVLSQLFDHTTVGAGPAGAVEALVAVEITRQKCILGVDEARVALQCPADLPHVA